MKFIEDLLLVNSRATSARTSNVFNLSINLLQYY